MGIFNIFQKKDVAEKRLSTMHSHVSEAFSNIHNHVSALNTHIEKQKEWLKYVHENHLTLHNKHEDHKELTKAEITRVNSWINFLHKSVQKQEKQLTEMQKAVQEAIKAHDIHLGQLYEAVEKANKKQPVVQKEIVHKEPDYDAITKAVLQSLTFDVNSMKADIKKELHGTLTTSLQEHHAKYRNEIQEVLDNLKVEEEQQQVQPVSQVQQPVHIQKPILQPAYADDWALQLTNPEQKLLNLMISESDPLSYSKISQLTGHSINTVRVTMNILKKKGFVEESALPSGVKLFSVTNKERIKKMYNVQVL